MEKTEEKVRNRVANYTLFASQANKIELLLCGTDRCLEWCIEFVEWKKEGSTKQCRGAENELYVTSVASNSLVQERFKAADNMCEYHGGL